MTIRPFLRGLLESLDPDDAASHSMLNHHALGFTYLNLLRTPRLTVKIYIAERGRVVGCGNGDYLVNPHDHNYAFDTHVLSGSVSNVLFEDGYPDDRFGGEHYGRKRYDTRTREHVSSYDRALKVSSVCAYRPGQSYSMAPTDIHTIVLGEETTVLAICQYRDIGTHTNLYVRKGDEARFDGLYMKPTRGDMTRMVAIARQAAKEPGP